MLTPETLALAALVGCLVLPWLLPFAVAPARMRLRSWQPADPTYTPDDDARLPSAARRAADDLRRLGFEDRGIWRHDGAAPATGWVVLLEHPRARDAAKVVIVEAGNSLSVTLAFQTRFPDEAEAVTANSPVVSGLPTPPGVTVAWLPEVRDPASLYWVHSQLRDALGGECKRVGPDPAAFLRAGSARSLAAWVAAGYYAADEVRGVVRPTWKGAALVTWRLLWPVRPLYRAARRRATRRLLDRLGIVTPF